MRIRIPGRSGMQRFISKAILRVNIRAACNQFPDQIVVVCSGRKMQRGIAAIDVLPKPNDEVLC